MKLPIPKIIERLEKHDENFQKPAYMKLSTMKLL